MIKEHKMKLFACRASKDFALKVAKCLNLELGASDVLTFSDGEFQPSFNESVRGATVFIVQSTFPPTDNLFELLLMADAAKRASAHRVIAVMPYYGWARQDRKDKPRVSIGAKLVANMLQAAGCDRVMTCDLHADQIQGFFDFPVDHIYASAVFLPYIKNLNLENLAIAANDEFKLRVNGDWIGVGGATVEGLAVTGSDNFIAGETGTYTAVITFEWDGLKASASKIVFSK